MADVFIATDGYDGNGGTSIEDAYATLQMANDDVGLSAGDTVWLVVKTNVLGAQQKFDLDVGTITISTSGTKTGGSIKWKATNASGVVDGTMAIVDFTGETLTAGGIHVTGNHIFFQNIGVENTASGVTGEGWLDDNSGNSEGAAGTELFFYGCSAINCGDDGFDSNSRLNTFYQCYASNNSGGGASGFRMLTNEDKHCIGCVSENNQNDGFFCGHDASVYFCIANNNGAMGFRDAKRAINCTSANNTDSGFYAGAESTHGVYMNNLIVGNATGFKIDPTATRSIKWIGNNAFGNNTSGPYDVAIDVSWEVEIGTITLSEDPFVNAGLHDFSLNNRTNGGQLCKNAGMSVARYTNTRNFLDIGAVQSLPRSNRAG